MSKDNIYSEIEVTIDTAKEVGLTEEEYNRIVEILGRTPTYTELGIFGVMWSEHCSYKNSILQLKTLPRTGGKLLVDAGEENAGLVDIGGGYAIAFKIESHNHPSAIEPFQGAATGVGGILRDIFSMGARPIAALNSLRFGNPDNSRTKYLFRGVVEGIGHYGNCFGVPTVAGEVYFDECYQDNPLVNAMAVGIVKIGETASAISKGAGNPVFIIGSSTGRDGIHGASLLASREFDDKTDDMRPTVQVGDPFAEKLLLESTLELIKSGVIVGIQDMGAAGISCSTSEMSAKGRSGMIIDLDKVPLREDNMSAYEIMLSESQERMLIIVERGKEEIARQICDKWDVPITQIGTVTDDGFLRIYRNGKYVAEIESNQLVLGGGAPQYVRDAKEPEYLKEVRGLTADKFGNLSAGVCNYIVSDGAGEIGKSRNIAESFRELLSSPTISSKRWVYEQYDSQVRSNTISIKGDAAILRIKKLSGKGIALCTDCNSRYVYLNPYRGAAIAVMEAARNVVCVGAEPVAITNCLNFGNPYDPVVYWQFKEAIRGMGDACRALNTPVTGGNVSFHNESQSNAIFPTPVIGMLGVIEDLRKTMSAGFKEDGDLICLIGNIREELGGSEYLKIKTGKIIGDTPIIDFEEELRLQKVILAAIKEGIINSAHDVSEGGIAICLAEKAILSDNKVGAVINFPFEVTEGILFGESQSRVIVSLDENNFKRLEKLCSENHLNIFKLGITKKNKFKINDILDDTVDNISSLYELSIPEIMDKQFNL